MQIQLRQAVPADIPRLQEVIEASVRGLQANDYTPAQIEGALKSVYGVDTQLISDGLLEVHPGRGTVVAELPASTARERTQLLKGELEALVVEAKRLQMDLGDVQAALSEHWERLGFDARSSRPGPHKGGKS